MLILGDDNETRIFPFVNLSLIAACLLVSVWSYCSTHTVNVLYAHGCVPARIFAEHDAAQYMTIVSSLFLHSGTLHLLGNLWFLYIFGDNIEEHFGHFKYLLFYLTCGIAACAAHIFTHATSWDPCIGASGAISGVLGAYLVLFPNAKLRTWWGDDTVLLAFRCIEIPAGFAIVLWFVMQWFCLSMNLPGIAWHAHIYGFVAGFTLVWLFRMLGFYETDKPHQTMDTTENVPLQTAAVSFLFVGVVTLAGAYCINTLCHKSEDAGANSKKVAQCTPAKKDLSSKRSTKKSKALKPAAHSH